MYMYMYMYTHTSYTFLETHPKMIEIGRVDA